MAEIDIIVRDKLWTFAIPCIIFGILLVSFLTDSLKDLRRKVFAKTIAEYNQQYNQATKNVKRELFADLNEIISNVVDLKNHGLIRILEIGVGSGENLQYYPQQSRLVVVDPNVYFKQYFMENLDKFPDIYLENYILGSAENIRGVRSNSVDVVVTTNVLCSVDNLQRVFKEIRRILVPDGRYYFLEHILDDPSTRQHVLQKFLTNTGIWPTIFDGCCFRDIDVEIAKAGFSLVEQKRFNLNPNTSRVINFCSAHVVGIATK